MSIKDNADRAESARKVLAFFRDIVPNDEDTETLVQDLICNIKHLLSSEGIDSQEVFDRAETQWHEEV